MSNNYQGPQQLGYGQNRNPNINAYNQQPTNINQRFGYQVNQPSNQINFNSSPQNNYYDQRQKSQPLWGNLPLASDINRVQNASNPYGNNPIPQNQANRNPYGQPNQVNQGVTNNYNNQTQPRINNQFGSQPQQQFFTSPMQNGGYNQATQPIRKENITPELQQGFNLWADLAKQIDWDSLIKQKNVTKKKSDTSWVTYQEQSWKKPQLSRNIQVESDRKFAFPNPYIKYKIIPGVDQKMALDVTAKDDIQKGYVKGNLIIWDYHGGPNQQFYIHRCPKNQNQQGFNSYQKNRIQDDEFILINAATGFVLSAISLNIGSSKKNENGLCVYPKMKDTQNQRWRLKPVNEKGDIFTIQSVDTGKVLDCEGASRSNGTNVIQWQSSQQKNQMWKIIPA